MANVKLFLSCVSNEFGDDRDALRRALTRLNVEIKIQEEFQNRGGDTLAMLEDYIESCDVVVHFAGEMAGSAPASSSVDDLLRRRPELAARLAAKGMDREALRRLTYTQWEAWLAIGFNKDGVKKNLVIVEPALGAKHGAKFAPDDASRASQDHHLARLKAIDVYPVKPFTSADNLVARVFGTAVLDALNKANAGSITKPRNLPFASLGGLFAGRDEDLADLHTALLGAKGAPVALHGLGGIGKTRLAIEYAWSRETVYSALLFVSATDGAALSAGLAGLTAFEILDLPEKEARDDATKITAVLRRLESNPTWLMILDNVDDSAAVAEVAKLMPRLKGGHVVVTARAANFPAFVRKLGVSKLDENAATQFLLDRTESDRNKTRDDATLSRALSRELDGLALGLEQAGAYITTEGIGFASYLKLWNEARDAALNWSDPVVTGADKTLATVWTTSVARLSDGSRRLLERITFLAPEPIPESLFDFPVPGEAAPTAASSPRAGLLAYSLISRVAAEDGGATGFVVHRLVQDFARRAMSDERRTEALSEALEWIDAAFIGEPEDVRSWPILDPLAPHALAVARAADASEISEPTARLFNRLAVLFKAKAAYAQAEQLDRRALAISEKSFGRNHPKVVASLHYLAFLLKDTKRAVESEQLFRRALAIDEKSHGRNHPNVVTSLRYLAFLLKDTKRTFEAEPLFRRALAIDQKNYGPNDPKVAIDLSDLAFLLKDTNRFVKAEQLFRRALAIDESNYGPNNPKVAIDLNSLAFSLHAAKRSGEAEPLVRRALAIDEARYGSNHPEVANDLNGLAGLLQDITRVGEAEPLLCRALAIDEQSYGPVHPNVAIRLNNLALLYQAQNRLAEAEPLIRRVLAIFAASYGPDHPQTVNARNNLAGLEAALSQGA